MEQLVEARIPNLIRNRDIIINSYIAQFVEFFNTRIRFFSIEGNIQTNQVSNLSNRYFNDLYDLFSEFNIKDIINRDTIITEYVNKTLDLLQNSFDIVLSETEGLEISETQNRFLLSVNRIIDSIGVEFFNTLQQYIIEIQGYKEVIWVTHQDTKVCDFCADMNGRVFNVNDDRFLQPPLHPHCRCFTKPALVEIEEM